MGSGQSTQTSTVPASSKQPAKGVSQSKKATANPNKVPSGKKVSGAGKPTRRQSEGSEDSCVDRNNRDRDGQLSNAIVKIFTTHCRPDFSVPWTIAGQSNSISSGFAFQVRKCKAVPTGLQDQKLLLTNAHCVEHAAVVQVRPRGSGTRYVARVLSIANDCDLALITVDEDAFWEGMEQLELVPGSDPPHPGEAVTIVGYPTGGDNTCVTQGVVSRLDLYDYVQGGKRFLAIQVDAAINSGSSGGPALNEDGNCVGIAFQTAVSEGVENQGEIIPTEIIMHFLADFITHGKYVGFPHPGFHVQRLESAALREFCGLKEGESGVRVKQVEPTSPAHGRVRVGDILTAVAGRRIGNDGLASYRFGERLPMQYLFHRKHVGSSIPLSLLRDGERVQLDLPLEEQKELAPSSVAQPPQYYIAGGLVFVPLSVPFAQDEFVPVERLSAALRVALCEGVKEQAEQEVVVLTRVLAHRVNAGYEELENLQVLAYQGERVRHLRDLSARMERDLADEAVQLLTLQLHGGRLVVLRRAEAVQATPQILAQNLVAARGLLAPALSASPAALPSSAAHPPH